MKSRKKYSPGFKGEVALAAIKGEETIASLAQKYELHPSQITQWKNELLKGIGHIFEKGKSKEVSVTPEVDYLERKIGQLTIEIDYLKKSVLYTPGREEQND
ncbi:MAG: transposase [Alphaproteobacteria bacterium]|nr:transposase [Alphaproteobacteria bacterium]